MSSTPSTTTPTLDPKTVSRLRHPTGRTLRAVVAALITAGVVAVPVVTATPALAVGSVANYCIVRVALDVHHPAPGGVSVESLPCGAGTHDVVSVTVWNHPFYVKMVGYPMFCMQAGHWHWPRNGGRSVDVIYPTVSCKS